MNQVLPFLHKGSLENTLTVPYNSHFTLTALFLFLIVGVYRYEQGDGGGEGG